jgi:hypothetical protein
MRELAPCRASRLSSAPSDKRPGHWFFFPPTSGQSDGIVPESAKERAHGLSSAPLLRLVPGSHVRPPTIHIPAIFFVLWSEFAAQSWLFIKEHEQVYAQGNGDHGGNRG